MNERDVSSDDARARILDAAETEFAERGFDATPTSRIAATAGVPKGLVFYYFPRKIDLLRALLAERLPQAPLCDLAGVARAGDPAGSLQRLARRLKLNRHESVVLRKIIFREADTHPEVRDQIGTLRAGLVQLAEQVLDAACEGTLPAGPRRDAAHTFVAVMIDEANSARYGGPRPDLAGAARVIAAGLHVTAAARVPAR